MVPSHAACGKRTDWWSRLLMRCLPKLSGRPPIHTGDVVAFKPPQGTDGGVLVRRVAAVGGEEMVSDNPDDQAFTLEPGTHIPLPLWIGRRCGGNVRIV